MAGKPHPITVEQRFHILGSPSIGFDKAVEFSEAELWSNVIELDKLKKMPLLRGKKNPAMVFRGSIRRITERDYEIVLKVKAAEGAGV